MARRSAVLLLALAHAAGVAAHGHVSNVVINGVYYENYDPTSFPYMTDPPIVAGWTAGDTDNGFIAPDAFNTSDIICHKNATNAGGHIGVAAGTYISIQWTPAWPESHHGPVIDYLANCNGLCEEVNKNDLQFFKIDGAGWISGGDPGVWAADTLEADNSTWLVQIPVDIAPGNYVLRHEIIALHAAESLDGAQAYPQCINLAISGTGTYQPSGTYGTALYHETDPGILYDIYTSPLPSYTVPGPTLISGVSSSCSQSSSTATATSSCTIPGSSASSTTATTAATTTAAGSTTKSTTSSTVKSTTTTASATTKTTTTTTTTTSAPAGTGSAQTLYGQCGGSGWTGATSCVAGATCSTLNAYYAQCVSA